MRVIKVSGESLDDLLNQVMEQFGIMENENKVHEPIKDQPKKEECKHHECHCGSATPDISKIFWIDKKVKDGVVYTAFNVIAPFAIEDTIKAAISKINDEYWLTLRYINDESRFADCTTCNFKTRKEVEYKYNFKDYKVDKKKLKLSYNKGIITLATISAKVQPKTEDYVIGL